MSGDDNIDPSANPSKIADLEVNEVDDGLVVFDPATQQVHYLNNTASVVFELADGTRTADQLAQEAAAVFDDPSTAEALQACVVDLRERGLVN